MRYKAKIAYEGTAYHGWQVQPNGVSIQELVEKALSTILREKTQILGSGRTDAGVHALGQVFHFDTAHTLDCPRMLYSLNGLLPKDIRILSLEIAKEHFHAQHSAISKVYRYHLYLDSVLSPFRRNFVWHLHFPIDLKILEAGSRLFLGTHDFTSFANEAHRGVAALDPIRTIQRIDFLEEEGGIAIEFEGDGFLYKMVRNLVGMLVDVSRSKCQISEIPKVLSAKDRRLAAPAAPPQGLFLVEVKYPLVYNKTSM